MSDPIIDRLDQIKGRADKATEGPWEAEYSGEQGNCVIPHDAQSTREAVAVTRLWLQAGDAEFIAAARTDVSQMEQALRAVLELHKRRDDLQHPNGGPICDGCGDLDGWESAWPCPPVRAIASALGVETEGGES